MDKDSRDFKPPGKNSTKSSPLDQYTKHFNYRIFPNFKIYSLSTQPASNPIESAAAAAATDNTFRFSDPPPIIKALPSDLAEEKDFELQKLRHQQHKEQHQNLQRQLEVHKNQYSEKQRLGSTQYLPNSAHVQGALATLPPFGGKPAFQSPKVTETLFAPQTTQQESSKSILFGTFNDHWMSNNDGSALLLAAGPIGDPADMCNRVRSVILKLRAPLADYQAKSGVPIQQQISFIDLVRMMFVCSQTAVFTILTMLWNLYPLLDGFLYVVRFVLDKTLYVCQAETSSERVYRGFISAGELIILFLGNLFIFNLIVMPITYLILCSMGNCMRLMGLH